MRLYTFVFLPALLFYFYEYSYLPYVLPDVNNSYPLVVYTEKHAPSVYAISNYDSDSRLIKTSFFHKDGNEFALISYLYNSASRVKEKTYFEDGVEVRKEFFFYGKEGILERSIVEDKLGRFYIYYDAVSIRNNSTRREEKWYLSEARNSLVQLKRSYYDENNRLLFAQYYKPSEDSGGLKVIYYTALTYNKSNGDLRLLSFYGPNKELLRVLDYRYWGTGVLRSIHVHKDRLSFGHESLNFNSGVKSDINVSFFTEVDRDDNLPAFVMAALGIQLDSGVLRQKEAMRREAIRKGSRLREPSERVITRKTDIGPSGIGDLDARGGVSVGAGGFSEPEDDMSLDSWFAELKEEITSEFYVYTDYTLLVGLEPNLFVKLDSKSKQFIWRSEVDSKVSVGPVVDSISGKIFIGTVNGTLYCLDSLGRLEWKEDIGSFLKGSSLLVKRDIVYVLHHNARVSAFSIRDGSLIWYYDPKERTYDYVSNLFASEDYIFLGIDDKVYIFNPSTGTSWTYHLDEDIINQPVVKDDILIVCSADAITAFRIRGANFRELWEFNDTRVTSLPYIGHDRGLEGLYVITDQGYILKLNITSGYLDWKTRINLSNNVLISGNYEHICINTRGNYFIILETRTGKILGSYTATARKKDRIITDIFATKDNDSASTLLFYGTTSSKIFKVVYR